LYKFNSIKIIPGYLSLDKVCLVLYRSPRDKKEIIHIEPGFILIGKPYIIVPVNKFSLMLLNIKMFTGDQSLG
jgi:hypothetical protein